MVWVPEILSRFTFAGKFLPKRFFDHGQDVKEYYFYLDRTPTHSYMKYRYK